MGCQGQACAAAEGHHDPDHPGGAVCGRRRKCLFDSHKTGARSVSRITSTHCLDKCISRGTREDGLVALLADRGRSPRWQDMPEPCKAGRTMTQVHGQRNMWCTCKEAKISLSPIQGASPWDRQPIDSLVGVVTLGLALSLKPGSSA